MTDHRSNLSDFENSNRACRPPLKPCSPQHALAAAEVAPALQEFHNLTTQRLNDKVEELQRLRTQNEVIEQKLLDFHALFARGQEGARFIVDDSAQPSGVDHETHEKVTAAGARKQDHAAEMDPAALQEPSDAAPVAGEAVNNATTTDQPRKSRPCSPDLQQELARSPKRWAPPHPTRSRSTAELTHACVLVRAAAPQTRATRPRPGSAPAEVTMVTMRMPTLMSRPKLPSVRTEASCCHRNNERQRRSGRRPQMDPRGRSERDERV